MKVRHYLVGILNNPNIQQHTLNAFMFSSLLLGIFHMACAPDGKSQWTNNFQTSACIMLADFPLAKFSHLSESQIGVGSYNIALWIPKRYDSLGGVRLIQ